MLSSVRQCLTKRTSLSQCLRVLAPRQSTKFMSTSNDSPTRKHNTQSDPTGEYSVVYRFPHIRSVAALARAKIYTTGLSVAAMPLVCIGTASGSLDPSYSAGITVTAAVSLGALYLASNLTRKLIGVISIHKDREHVRIGRLTFWGGRKNLFVPIDTIIPLSEGRKAITDVYTDVKTIDNSVDLHIIMRHGGILNMEDFEHIFGRIMD